MLAGYYKIDGIDLWESFGALILRDSYGSLLQYPTRREPDRNDWFEEDRLEVDLTQPTFDAFDVELKIGIYSNNKEDLLDKKYRLERLLKSGGYKTLAISSLSLQLELRYVGASNGEASPLEIGNFFYLEQSVKLVCDNPLQLFSINTTPSTFDFTFDHTLRSNTSSSSPIPFFGIKDNFFESTHSFQSYGVAVKSVNGSALEFDSVKEPLIQTFTHTSGNLVSIPPILTISEKSLIFDLVMVSDTINTLLANYRLFFKDLASAGIRTIHSTAINTTFSGYYSNQSDLSLHGLSSIGGYYFLEFKINFTITN